MFIQSEGECRGVSAVRFARAPGLPPKAPSNPHTRVGLSWLPDAGTLTTQDRTRAGGAADLARGQTEATSVWGRGLFITGHVAIYRETIPSH